MASGDETREVEGGMVDCVRCGRRRGKGGGFVGLIGEFDPVFLLKGWTGLGSGLRDGLVCVWI